MLKASALYLVIIIALVIGILCSSLIAVAYFYRAEYQKKIRYDHLQLNVNSGVNVLLGSGYNNSFDEEKYFSLFDNGGDSVALHRFFWGVFDIGTCKAFIQRDTLYKTFVCANAIDSSKWAALYFADDDNPISVSGKTLINGNAFLPKAGITQAIVDGRPFEGDPRLVLGHKYISNHLLPLLNQHRINLFKTFLSQNHPGDTILRKDSITNSFLLKTHYINFGRRPVTITNQHLEGNLIITSDTSVTLDRPTLNNVIIFSKSIKVKDGFRGTCQLFAMDTLSVGPNCTFDYPSCLGIFNQRPNLMNKFPQILIDANTRFSGIIFTYSEDKKTNSPIIVIDKNVKISGELYSQNPIKFLDGSTINGSLYTSDIIYFKESRFFKGYLIDLRINVKALSSYYLTSELMPTATERKKVLQWIETIYFTKLQARRL